MIRQETRQKAISHAYASAVVEELQNKLDLSPAEARKMFLKYYRAMKRTWGFQLNAGEFADRMIELNRSMIKRLRLQPIKDIKDIAVVVASTQHSNLDHIIMSHIADVRSGVKPRGYRLSLTGSAKANKLLLNHGTEIFVDAGQSKDIKHPGSQKRK